MSAATKRRGRPETPLADYGPAVRLANGTAVLSYRADPAMPGAPDIRAATALVIYDHMHAAGYLTDPQREAADRYLIRYEQAAGAVEAQGERIRGGNGQGTPTERQVAALADIRLADGALAHDRDMVRDIVVQNRTPPGGVDTLRVARALGRVAAVWGMS